MKINVFPFVLLVFLLLTSCQDDYLSDDAGGILLKEIVADGEVFYKYTYNDAGFIAEEKSKFHYSKHTYNSRNQIIQSDYYWDESIFSSSSYVLDEAKQRKEWVNPENTNRDTYSTYQYNRSGQLFKRISQTNEDYSIYTYKNNRIVKRKSFHEDIASVVDNYYFDDAGILLKKNAFIYWKTAKTS